MISKLGYNADLESSVNHVDSSPEVQKSLNPMWFCSLRRWGLGLPGLVFRHDLQHAAGSGVPEGPPRGIRRAARPAGRA